MEIVDPDCEKCRGDLGEQRQKCRNSNLIVHERAAYELYEKR